MPIIIFMWSVDDYSVTSFRLFHCPIEPTLLICFSMSSCHLGEETTTQSKISQPDETIDKEETFLGMFAKLTTSFSLSHCLVYLSFCSSSICCRVL